MTNPHDYTQRGWMACTLLIFTLLAISFIPPQSVIGLSLRRVNILSDLITFNDPTSSPSSDGIFAFEEAEYAIDLKEVAAQVAEMQPHTVTTHYLWTTGETKQTAEIKSYPRPLTQPSTPIEDFDSTANSRMKSLYTKLLTSGTPVHIAVLGDSFIEGDILTADLREKLQSAFGGCGAGFAPMASPLTGFRRTIKTQARNWTPYNIMQRKSTPAALASNYTISGWVCRASEGASTRWEGTTSRLHLDSCNQARLFFISRQNSQVEVTLNDTQKRIFEIEGDEALRQIDVTGAIRSIAMKVISGNSGFIGYGAQFSGEEGVTVDNYSIRSNNGQAMFWTDPALNVELDNQAGGYDLVILQYGLNILQKGVRNYSKYGEQIENMIAFVRQCFPTAAVLVLGVSDRSTRTDDGSGFVPMDSAPYLINCQRAAAQHTGAAFWSTYDAMQARGGMAGFVNHGWAGKDYTHINFGGGRQIAHDLFDALYNEVFMLQQKTLSRQIHRHELEPTLTPQAEAWLYQDTIHPRP
ncbi:MAG: hypothetical protein RR330_05265 [Alistipes sp.]